VIFSALLSKRGKIERLCIERLKRVVGAGGLRALGVLGRLGGLRRSLVAWTPDFHFT
jgi:hypothetical protein